MSSNNNNIPPQPPMQQLQQQQVPQMQQMPTQFLVPPGGQQQRPISPRAISPRSVSPRAQTANYGYGQGFRSTSDIVPPDEAVDVNALKAASTTSDSGKVGALVEASFALEQREVAASSSKTVFGVLKLVTPAVEVTAGKAAKQPVDLVCVVDHSGSMSGLKIQLLRDTLMFITRSLEDADRFSIVQFDSTARIVTGLNRMHGEGKAKTSSAISEISADGGTDIAAGLELGLKVLRERKHRNAIASVLLLTDGQDAQSLHKLDDVMRDMPKCSIHTFGLGSDHDARVLTAISTRVQGTFTYIETLAAVGPAFASTLGGLVSIVAIDIDVSIACRDATLVDVHTKYQHSIAADRTSASVTLPDLFGSESRDIVFEVHIGERANASADDDVQELMTGGIKYSVPGVAQRVAVDASALKLLRPARVSADVAINVDVNAQRNRVLATEALQSAAAAADKGDLTAARETIDGAIATITASASASHRLCVELLKDLASSRARVVDQRTFQSGGYAQMSHQAQQHGQQRQTNSAQSSAYGYNVVQTAMMNGYSE